MFTRGNAPVSYTSERVYSSVVIVYSVCEQSLNCWGRLGFSYPLVVVMTPSSAFFATALLGELEAKPSSSLKRNKMR